MHAFSGLLTGMTVSLSRRRLLNLQLQFFDCQICSWFDLTCFLDSQFAHEVHACFDGEDYDAKVIINEVELTTMIYMVLLYGLAA